MLDTPPALSRYWMAIAIGSFALARFSFVVTEVSSEVAPAADTEVDFMLPIMAVAGLALPLRCFTLKFTAFFTPGFVTAVAGRADPTPA